MQLEWAAIERKDYHLKLKNGRSTDDKIANNFHWKALDQMGDDSIETISMKG